MHGPLTLDSGSMNSDTPAKTLERWLGRFVRLTLTDGRVFEGQLVAIDSDRTLLVKYCEFRDRKASHLSRSRTSPT